MAHTCRCLQMRGVNANPLHSDILSDTTWEVDLVSGLWLSTFHVGNFVM